MIRQNGLLTLIIVFREMIKTLIIPDLLPEMLISSLDLELIEVLPDLLNSPYVEVDPAMRVVYYNALFFGFHRLRGPGNEFSKLAYFKVLEAVPEWLTKATGTELDALCAAVTVRSNSVLNIRTFGTNHINSVVDRN